MRLLFFTDRLGLSGTDALLRDLWHCFSRFGWECHLVTEQAIETPPAGVHTHPCPDSAESWDRLLKRVRPRLGIGIFGRIVEFALACRRSAVLPVWLCTHPSWLEHEGSSQTEQFARARELALTLYSHIIVPSRYLRRELAAPEGTAVEVIPVGMELDRLSPPERSVARDLRESLGVGPEEFLLGYAARFVAYKNHRALLDVLDWLQSRIPGVHLMFCGASAEARTSDVYQRLRDLCRERGWEKRVHFVCPPVSELPRYYGAMDLFLFPSQRESFGLAVTEAMACGTPVLALRSPALEETLRGYPPEGLADSLEGLSRGTLRLLRERALRERLSRRGRRLVREKYDLPLVAERYRRVLSALAEGAGTGVSS